MMVLLPVSQFLRPGASTGLVTFGCGTDNQGNSFLMDRLMATKYPLGLILIELSHQLALRRAALRARWIPRLQNEEADALTNEDFRHFDLSKRVEVDLKTLPFGVLHGLLAVGDQYVDELAKAKLVTNACAATASKKRRKAGDASREKDPW